MSAEGPTRSVERLRSEIETVDRSIVLLLGARERAQHRLLAVKASAGIAGIDPEQERRVIARARAWARESGSDEQLAAEVIRLALESGKRAYFENRSDPPPFVPGRETVARERRGLRGAVPRVNSG